MIRSVKSLKADSYSDSVVMLLHSTCVCVCVSVLFPGL